MQSCILLSTKKEQFEREYHLGPVYVAKGDLLIVNDTGFDSTH